MINKTQMQFRIRKLSSYHKVHKLRHRTNKRQRIPRRQSKKDNPEKLATQGTQDTGQINVREYLGDNQKRTIQRNWQHRVHKIRHRTNKRQRIPRGQSKKYNLEKLAT